LRNRGVRRRLERVVQQAGVDRVPGQYVEVVRVELLADRVLTGAVGVADRQVAAGAVGGLVDVTGDDVVHRVALVLRDPPLNLVHHDEGGSLTLQGQRGAGGRLDGATLLAVDHRAVNLKPELLLQVPADHRGEQREGVAGLVLRHRRDLNPRGVLARADRHVRKISGIRLHRTAKLGERQGRYQRVFAPALEPAKQAG